MMSPNVNLPKPLTHPFLQYTFIGGGGRRIGGVARRSAAEQRAQR